MKALNKFLDEWRSEEGKSRGEKFGLGVSVATAAMSVIALYRGNMERMDLLALVSASLLACALVAPWLLFPVAWLLEEAFKLTTKALMYVLLLVVFFIVFTPAGLAIRILGKDPLDTKLDPQAKTYWKDRQPHDPKRVEKQF